MTYRSLHFIPGDKEEYLKNIELLNADAFVFDLEDGVGHAHKAKARENISLISPAWGKKFIFRVNGADTEFFQKDVECLSRLNFKFGVMLPKVDTNLKKVIERTLACLGDIDKFIILESFSAFSKRAEIIELYQPFGVCLGMEDLMASLPRKTVDFSNLALHIQRDFVVSCLAYNMPSYDSVSLNVNNAQAFQSECEESASAGFTGKMTIHPMQIDIVNNLFKPSDAEILWSESVLAAEEKVNEFGYCKYNGEIIGPPKLKKAKAVLAELKGLKA